MRDCHLATRDEFRDRREDITLHDMFACGETADIYRESVCGKHPLMDKVLNQLLLVDIQELELKGNDQPRTAIIVHVHVLEIIRFTRVKDSTQIPIQLL